MFNEDESEKLFVLKNVLGENYILATHLQENITDQFLTDFSSLGSIVSFEKNSILIREGEFNQKLFFIISGTLNVIVEEESVAIMSKRGSVVGEIGFLTNLPSTATIIATTDVRLLLFDYKIIKEHKSDNSILLISILYQLFAKILSLKLVETNNKAKQFERINKQLELTKKDLEKSNTDLEQKMEQRTIDLKRKAEELIRSQYQMENQNSALLASNKKLEDLYNNRKSTLSKLDKLYNVHLKNLKESIALATSSDLANISLEIDAAMEELRPISELCLSENSMRHKKLLIFEGSRKQQTTIKLALAGTGIHLTFTTTSEETMAELQKNSFDIILINTENIDFAQTAYDHNPSMKQILVTAAPIPSYLEKLKKFHFINNVISKNDDRTFTIKNISTTISKISGQDIFGLEHYLSWGVEVKSKKVNNSKIRKQLISDLQIHFSELGIRSTIIDKCQFVAEELLMNIIYDAPTDCTGKSLYNHLPRTIQVQLKPEEEGIFRYASDGVIAAISTQDPFGELSKDIILNYLNSCYQGQGGSLNLEKGGAGRGLYQIIEIADVVIFNVIPHKKTEVIALFNLDIRTAKKLNTPSFHLFYL